MRNYINSPIDLVTRCYFGGGKSPKTPKYDMPAMPALPKPPPPPPPPPEVQNMSASDAAEQQRMAASKRDGYRKTILAGETGGYAGNPVTGNNSLLG